MNSLMNLNLNKNVGTTERIISALAGSFLVFHGMRKGRKLSEIPVGSFLLFRGATGYCPVKERITTNGHAIARANGKAHPTTCDIDTNVVINKPRHEVYAFWRKLENLPLFMKHLESVKVIDEKTSLWAAKIPGGFGTIEWESEITTDVENERISWRSLPDSEIRNSGNVEFRDAGNGTTNLHAVISYEAPGGIIGEKVGQLLNPVFEKMVQSDIASFKKYIESR